MDYNADIPFERKPIAGAYDTRDEINKEFVDPNFTQIQLHKMEPKKRHEIQEERQKEYNKKQKILKDKQKEGLVPSAQLEQLSKQQFTANRRKLVLPAPQIGESELEEVSARMVCPNVRLSKWEWTATVPWRWSRMKEALLHKVCSRNIGRRLPSTLN